MGRGIVFMLLPSGCYNLIYGPLSVFLKQYISEWHNNGYPFDIMNSKCFQIWYMSRIYDLPPNALAVDSYVSQTPLKLF